MPVPPLPGMEIFGWIIWLLLLLIIGGGIVLIAKSILPNLFQQTAGNDDRLRDVMGELLREIKELKEEIKGLRKELKE